MLFNDPNIYDELDLSYFSQNGRYGQFGGSYLPELLMTPIAELTQAWNRLKRDNVFKKKLMEYLINYAGRPTPLTELKRLREKIGGPRIFLKREDLLHTGAHKLNNSLGQCLLAKEMGKTRVIAETGAGQHGVATAAACAFLGLECVIYMGCEDMKRQRPNVLRMQLLGAKIESVASGQGTLKEAVNEALREWATSYEDSHYCLGSALGPHPYPEMVAAFQSVIGYECQNQCQSALQCNPDMVVACVGGGSNAIGIFSAFLDDPKIRLVGIEAGGCGDQLGEHAARFKMKTEGVLHGCYTYLLQNDEGQVAPTSSISAGLDYPAVGPQHAQLFNEGRAEYYSVKDPEALDAMKLLARTEGVICALESAHAIAGYLNLVSTLSSEHTVIINCSGRGDKDLSQIIDGNSL